MTSPEVSIDRYVQIALIAALSYWSFVLIKPFLSLLAWGFILAVAVYPAYAWLSKRLGNRPVLAAALLTLTTLVLVISILSILTNSMVASLTELIRQLRNGEQIIPAPPANLASWPLIGDPLSHTWELASTNLAQAVTEYSRYITNAGTLVLTGFANKSVDFIVFILSVIFAGYLLVRGGVLVSAAREFVERVAPGRSDEVLSIIRSTIQNVSVGVIGIAVFQTLMFGLSLLIAGVPGTGLLIFAALILCIAQIGLIILMIPVGIWLFMTYTTPLAIGYGALIAFTGLIDNILKPFVLSHGLRTPIIVILLGVLGGVIWHGLIGVFIGPVILAIFYDLFQSWLKPAN